MSLDRSLKTSGALEQHRSVLTRVERLEKLIRTKNFDPAKKPVIGMPKTLNMRVGT
ncbi:MAG: small basic protein [Phycisphaerales bacterium]